MLMIYPELFATGSEPPAGTPPYLTDKILEHLFWCGVAYHSIADSSRAIKAARDLKTAREPGGVTRASGPEISQKRKPRKIPPP